MLACCIGRHFRDSAYSYMEIDTIWRQCVSEGMFVQYVENTGIALVTYIMHTY